MNSQKRTLECFENHFIHSAKKFRKEQELKNGKKSKHSEEPVEYAKTYIFSNYINCIEDMLKDSSYILCYHWRTDEDDKRENLKMFFELDDAKEYFKKHRELDISALEIYQCSSKLKEKFDGVSESFLINRDSCLLFESIPVPETYESDSYFTDILKKDDIQEQDDPYNCYMEDDSGKVECDALKKELEQ